MCFNNKLTMILADKVQLWNVRSRIVRELAPKLFKNFSDAAKYINPL